MPLMTRWEWDYVQPSSTATSGSGLPPAGKRQGGDGENATGGMVGLVNPHDPKVRDENQQKVDQLGTQEAVGVATTTRIPLLLVLYRMDGKELGQQGRHVE